MKSLKIILAISILAGILAIVYWNRAKNINFANNLPIEITFCGENIPITEESYLSLKNWFQENQNGWTNSLDSWAPQSVFRGKEMHINVLKDLVVVNYGSGKGKWAWSQVIKKHDNKIELPQC